MHSAPAVSFPLGRVPGLVYFLWAIWGLGAGVAGMACYFFGSNLADAGWRQAVLVIAVLAAAAGLGHFLRCLPTGVLRGAGGLWQLDDPVGLLADARASVHVDLGRLMLVRLVGAAGQARWLCLARGQAPERWRALRRALHSGLPAGDGRAAPGPAAP